MDNLILREARKQDIPVLADLWLELDSHVAASALDAGKFQKTENYRSFVVRWLGVYLGNVDASVLVADLDGSVVGFVSCQIQVMPWYQVKRIGLIGPCYVKPLYRRRKIGARLVKQVESWLQEQAVEYVDVVWDHGNQAAEDFWYGIGYHCSQIRASKRLP